MKRILLYLVSAFLLTACIPDLGNLPQVEEGRVGESVTVWFSVPDIPVGTPTKSIEDPGEGKIGGSTYLDPDRFYLAVCGSSQSIKYIRKAKYDPTQDRTIAVADIPNYPLTDRSGDDQVTLHTFSVQLELDEKERTIHFLGNIDENQLMAGGFAYDILPGLLSYEGKQAYWQSVTIPHIVPERDDNGNPKYDDQGYYVLDKDVAEMLEYVPLIRNYATIQVINGTDQTNPETRFELFSYAVVYQPTRGAVVPFRSNCDDLKEKFSFGFKDVTHFSGFERCSFQDLDNVLSYPGNLPATVAIDKTIPDVDLFRDPDNVRVIKYEENNPEVNAGRAFYIYERGVPTSLLEPTFIILRGKLYGAEPDPEHQDEQGYSYYRLDLMETKTIDNKSVSKYYPLYRNFRYCIELNRISSVGVATPEAAANSSGIEDISADFSMRHLSDISNGITRLVVEPYMAQTFTGESMQELYVRFFDNIESATPNYEPNSVYVELEPTNGYEDFEHNIITLYDDAGRPLSPQYSNYFPSAESGTGIRTIRFKVREPLEETLTQKIKITGRPMGSDEKLRLYREVEITLQNRQTMTVVCDPREVAPAKGKQVTVKITIPSGLPDSMFPLDFLIEAEDMSLSPDNNKDLSQAPANSKNGNNLPVRSGKSLSTTDKFKNTATFQFVRTLTLEDYQLTPSGQSCTFESYFVTNRKDSATKVWVDNKYFVKASDSFTNTVVPTNHFYIKAEEDGCVVKVNNSGLSCKKTTAEGEGEWMSYASGTAITLDKNETLSICGYQSSWKGPGKITGSRSYSIGGNIASLIVGDSYEEYGSDISSYTFLDFLKNDKQLVSAEDLIIPMEKTYENCFKSMFDGCSNLEEGPALLPALTVANASYRNMFKDCSSLKKSPVIRAQNYSSTAFQQMFLNCKSLEYIYLAVPSFTQSAFRKTDGTEPTWVCVKEGNDEVGTETAGVIWLNPSLRNNTEGDDLTDDRKAILVPKYKDTQGEWHYWTVKWIGIDPEE